MDDPNSPLGWAVWQRGAALGLRLVFVFFAVTGIVYAAMGIIGWSGVVRALCAMCAGPIIAVLGVVLWWRFTNPPLLPDAAAPDEPPGA
ncbi:MAG: hypothetical protein JW966_05920 [Anaerolineae bacterium]|nr:hypothetical protein [Anaerolineae bacterium]